MHIFFSRLLFIASLSIASTTSYGQGPTTSKPMKQISEPLYIINSTIIANGKVTQIKPNSMREPVVYRNQEVPSALKNLTSGSIFAFAYDGQIDSKSFAEIGRQYNVQGPLSFLLNGHKLSAEQITTFRIASEAIGQVQVTRATASTAETILNIQLTAATKDSRKNSPGTILVR